MVLIEPVPRKPLDTFEMLFTCFLCLAYCPVLLIYLPTFLDTLISKLRLS